MTTPREDALAERSSKEGQAKSSNCNLQTGALMELGQARHENWEEIVTYSHATGGKVTQSRQAGGFATLT